MASSNSLIATGIDPKLMDASVRRVKARRRFIEFVTYTKPDYIVEPVHAFLAAKLQDFVEKCERGESPRLIIKMGPQHGKSQLSSRHLPAWVLGRNPKWHVALMSYSASWATALSRDARNILDSDEFRELWPEVRLAEDAKAADEWLLSRKSGEGGMVSVGRDGGITGRPANILVVDDPLKNRDEAYSPVVLKSLIEGFGPNFRTRMAMGGGILVVTTQWSYAELVAHLVDLGKKDPLADQYEVINLTAIAEANDPLGREIGEALAPLRHDLKDLAQIRASLDSPLDWEALYFGRPLPESGAIFNLTDLVCEPTPREQPGDWIFMSADTAYSLKRTADYTVIGVWRVEKTVYRLLHMVRARLTFPELTQTILALDAEFLPLCTLIEDIGSGKSLGQELQTNTRLPIVLWVPDRDKVARANASSALFRSHKVRYPDDAAWLADYTQELIRFPAAAHDDQVDMTTMALTWARDQQPRTSPTTQTNHAFSVDAEEEDPELTDLWSDLTGTKLRAEINRVRTKPVLA